MARNIYRTGLCLALAISIIVLGTAGVSVILAKSEDTYAHDQESVVVPEGVKVIADYAVEVKRLVDLWPRGILYGHTTEVIYGYTFMEGVALESGWSGPYPDDIKVAYATIVWEERELGPGEIAGWKFGPPSCDIADMKRYLLHFIDEDGSHVFGMVELLIIERDVLQGQPTEFCP